MHWKWTIFATTPINSYFVQKQLSLWETGEAFCVYFPIYNTEYWKGPMQVSRYPRMSSLYFFIESIGKQNWHLRPNSPCDSWGMPQRMTGAALPFLLLYVQMAMKPKGGVFSIRQWFEHVNPSESPLTSGLYLEVIWPTEGIYCGMLQCTTLEVFRCFISVFHP